MDQFDADGRDFLSLQILENEDLYFIQFQSDMLKMFVLASPVIPKLVRN